MISVSSPPAGTGTAPLEPPALAVGSRGDDQFQADVDALCARLPVDDLHAAADLARRKRA